MSNVTGSHEQPPVHGGPGGAPNGVVDLRPPPRGSGGPALRAMELQEERDRILREHEKQPRWGRTVFGSAEDQKRVDRARERAKREQLCKRAVLPGAWLRLASGVVRGPGAEVSDADVEDGVLRAMPEGIVWTISDAELAKRRGRATDTHIAVRQVWSNVRAMDIEPGWTLGAEDFARPGVDPVPAHDVHVPSNQVLGLPPGGTIVVHFDARPGTEAHSGEAEIARLEKSGAIMTIRRHRAIARKRLELERAESGDDPGPEAA